MYQFDYCWLSQSVCLFGLESNITGHPAKMVYVCAAVDVSDQSEVGNSAFWPMSVACGSAVRMENEIKMVYSERGNRKLSQNCQWAGSGSVFFAICSA